MQPSLHPSPAPDRATTKCRKLQTELRHEWRSDRGDGRQLIAV